MKKTVITTLFALFALVLLAPASAQERVYAPSAKMLKTHPRLFMPKGEERDVKKSVKSTPYWNEVNSFILAQADLMLEKPLLEKNVVGRRLLGVSREALARVTYLSYAYRTTGDEKYAAKAVEEMLTVSKFDDWNPSHFLDVAEMTATLAIGYDWLYAYLPATSRLIIADAIIEKGLKTSLVEKNNAQWIENKNNWNQVCHSGLALGAMAIWENEPELAQQIVARSVNNIRIPMGNYAPDGAYAEGGNYWEYGTLFNVLLIDALNGMFGSDYGLTQAEGFDKTFGYISHMITPRGGLYCYGDNPTMANFYVSPFWFAREQDDTQNLQPFTENIGIDKDRHRLLPLAVVWGHKIKFKSPSKLKGFTPTSDFWIGGGETPVAVMKYTQQRNYDYVGVKLGTASISHAHLDMGSFYYESDGVRWALDMGADNYNKMEVAGVDLWNRTASSQRWDVYRYNNQQHNVPTFNRNNQDVTAHIDFVSHSSAPDSMAVSFDLTPLYKSDVRVAKRSVIFKPQEALTITDEWQTKNRFTQVEWTVMTEAVPTLVEGGVLLTSGNKTMLLKADTDLVGSWYIETAEPFYSFNSPNPGIYKVVYRADLNLKTNNQFSVSFTKN